MGNQQRNFCIGVAEFSVAFSLKLQCGGQFLELVDNMLILVERFAILNFTFKHEIKWCTSCFPKCPGTFLQLFIMRLLLKGLGKDNEKEQ
jgi:hypothetical protein